MASGLMRAALIGASVGAAYGLVSSEKSMLGGAMVGAGLGAGIGYGMNANAAKKALNLRKTAMRIQKHVSAATIAKHSARLNKTYGEGFTTLLSNLPK